MKKTIKETAAGEEYNRPAKNDGIIYLAIDNLRQEVKHDFLAIKIKQDITRLDEKIVNQVDGLRQEMKEEISKVNNKTDAKADNLRQEMVRELGKMDARIEKIDQKQYATIFGIFVTLLAVILGYFLG